MTQTVDFGHSIPLPRDFETKAAFIARWLKSPAVADTYPGVGKRRLMCERAWARAKRDCLVSISTGVGEVLLFGKL